MARVPSTAFVESLQVLPVGTKVIVKAERPPENKIVEASLVVREDDVFNSNAGLDSPPVKKFNRRPPSVKRCRLVFGKANAVWVMSSDFWA